MHNSYAALLALALTACATAPADLQAIKDKVDARLTYQHYKGWDRRYLPQGGMGNCAVYATNYATDARRMGLEAKVVGCHTKSGEGHAYAAIDGWALDNRMSRVVPVGENGCE